MDIPSWQYLHKQILLALACLLAGGGGLLLSGSERYSSEFWPSAGVALGALLAWGYSLWPGVLVGHFTLALLLGLPVVSAACVAAGSTLAAVAGRAMLQHRWVRFDSRMQNVCDIVALAILGGVVGGGLAAGGGMLGLVLGDDPGRVTFGHWLSWWVGEAAGVLLLTPVVLYWAQDDGLPRWKPLTEPLGVLFLLAAVCGLTFGGFLPISGSEHLPIAFLPLPFLVWIAVRLHLRWTVLGILLLAGFSVAGTVKGYGPFVRQSSVESLTLLWGFVILAGLLGLLLGVGVSTHRRRRDYLRLIVEANPNAIVLTDGTGRILLANHRSKILFGYEPSELVDQPVELLLPAARQERHVRYREQYLADPRARPMGSGRDLFAVRKDGSEIPVEIGLAPIELESGTGVLAAVTDISERKLAEQALREERNFIATVLDTAEALVVVLDCDFRIVRFNKVCERVSGYRFDDIRGRSLWDLDIVPAEESPTVQEVASGLQQGYVHGYWENHWQNRDGDRRLISWSSNVVHGLGGEIEFLVSIGLDITERRRTEEEVRRWRAQQVHLDRLSTAAEMASGLAHELNQPLTAIASYCDVAQTLVGAMPSPPDRLLEMLEKTSLQAQRAGSIIRQLRGFVSKTDKERDWVDLNGLVRDTLGFVDADVQRMGARVSLELADSLPQLRLNRVQIEQVLVNLVRNACEAMESVDSAVRELRLRTALAEQGRHVEVSLQDTGSGLDPVLADRIFKPFETTKNNGLGMGLAISRSIVESYGGRLWAEGAPGGGTVFHFTLPVTAAGDET